jgi:hypothetical protein
MDTFPHNLAPMMRRAITLLVLVSALSMAAPMIAAASGGTPAQAISDCNGNGRLTQSYSANTLRQALAQMPADVKEYTDCYDVIERQLFKQLGQTAPGSAAPSSSSGSSFLPTWLIIVIVVLALAAITFGAMAVRRRSGGPGGPESPGGPPSSGSSSTGPSSSGPSSTGPSSSGPSSSGPSSTGPPSSGPPSSGP